MPGTNNWYTEDGYGYGASSEQRRLLCQLFRLVSAGCRAHYELSRFAAVQGIQKRRLLRRMPITWSTTIIQDTWATACRLPWDPNQFTIPPTRQNNIGLLLNKHGVSWKYYGEGWAGGTESGENGTFCNICNPFLYSTQIMTSRGSTQCSSRGHHRPLFRPDRRASCRRFRSSSPTGTLTAIRPHRSWSCSRRSA